MNFPELFPVEFLASHGFPNQLVELEPRGLGLSLHPWVYLQDGLGQLAVDERIVRHVHTEVPSH